MKNKFLFVILMLLCSITYAGNRDLTPHWVLTQHTGMYGQWCGNNMTGAFVVMIDGQLVQNTNYELAAFIGDELVSDGYFPDSEHNYVYYPVMNGYDLEEDEEVSDNHITFRIFDHATNQILDMVSATMVIYSDGGGVGTPVYPFVVSFFTGETRFELVTDASNLQYGDLIVIADAEGNFAMNTEQATNTRGASEVSVSNGILTWDDGLEYLPQVIELYKGAPCYEGQFSLFVNDGYLWAAGSNNNKRLRTGAKPANANYAWVIDITDGEAEIVAQGSNTNNVLSFDGEEIFTCYGNVENPVSIYKMALAPSTFTVTLTPEPTEGGTVEGAGTYNPGTSVTITAFNNQYYWFDHWVNNADNSIITANPYTFTITSDMNLTAIFNGTTRTVTLDPGTGTCATTSLEETEIGGGVTLIGAVPCEGASNNGYEFVGWAESEVEETATAPTLYEEGYLYHPLEDITLFAVYYNSDVYNTNPTCSQSAETPVIEGPTGIVWEGSADVTITCATAGATIYYTLDGSIPTTASNVYDGTITLTESATVKAIAGGVGYITSGVAEMTFTFGLSYETIAEFKAANSATNTVPSRITSDIVVVFKNGKNIYVQDETAALLLFDNNSLTTNNYQNGDVISGGVYGTYTLYNGLNEMSLTQALPAGVAGTPVQPTEVTVAEINANFLEYESRLVKIIDVMFVADATINSSNRTANFTQGGDGMILFNNFKTVNMQVEATRHYDLVGFTTVFNSDIELLPRNNNDIIPYYNVTVAETENGTITASPEYALPGTTITLANTPAAGYMFNNDYSITYGATTETLTEGSFDMPEADVIVNGTFSPIPPETFTVTLQVAEIGTGEVSGEGFVNGIGSFDGGTSVTVVATPADHYDFVSWTKDGEVVSNLPNYTFTVTEDVTLVATFAPTTYTVTINVDPEEGGTAQITSGEAPFHYGDDITVLATPNTGYALVNWTVGEEVVQGELLSFTVTDNVVVTAHFAKLTFVITATVNPAEAGTITGLDQETYEFGEEITLVANPAADYAFTSWTEGEILVTTSPTYTFTVTGDRDLVANFAQNTFMVNVLADPEEGGTPSGTGSYEANTNATLEANPATGYDFVNWTVGNEVVSTQETYTFEVTDDITVTAHYELHAYNITFGANPIDGGTVSIAEAAPYYYGTTLHLTATPNPDYNFVNWTMGTEILDTQLTLEVDVEGDMVIMANFEPVVVPPTMYTVTVNANPAVGGEVTGAGEYEEGTEVTVSATPTTDYVFVNWTEGETVVSEEATYTFTIEGNRDLVANFEPVVVPPTMYTVTVNANPAVGGEVAGAGEYEEGTEVTVSATPATDYVFVNWTEGETVVSEEAVYTFTIAGNRDLVANFEPVVVPPTMYTVTVNANPAVGGEVTGAGEYEEGTEVTVNATPAADYVFVNWTEGETVVSEEAVYTFTIAGNRDLVANFEPVVVPPTMYTITVLPCENGTITAPATAASNTTVTVTATPDPSYVLNTLYYYTTDPEETTAINMATLEFVMPEADVTIVGAFVQSENNHDVNNDGIVNIVDVIAIINYIAGNEPTPFIVERAYVNGDDVIDIADAMALNALILGMKGDCEDLTAQYDIIDGKLYIESPVALAGYQFSLNAEPTVIDMPGFNTIGNWKDGEYVLCLFNLSNEKEAGMYAVLDLNGGNVGDIVAATLQGCKVNMEKGTLSVNSFDEALYSVYPVPTNTEITVEGPSIQFVEVYNAMGQLVKKVNDINADSAKVVMSDLSAGNYMVRIHASNGTAVKSVIVVK